MRRWKHSWRRRRKLEQILSLIGLARKAGRVAVGEESTGAAARDKSARLLLVAADAADSSSRRASVFAESGKCPLLTVALTKAELGHALGYADVAMLAVTDFGFAAAIAGKLASRDEAAYGETARHLAALSQRARKRRQKKLRRSAGTRPEKGRKTT